MDNQRFEQTGKKQNEIFEYDIANIFEFDIGSFPKEFERQWGDLIDRRFALIFLVSFIFHFTIALYFAYNPPKNEISFKDIKKIQNNYVDLILKKPVIEEKPEKADFAEAITKNETLEETESEDKAISSNDQKATNTGWDDQTVATGNGDRTAATRESKVRVAESQLMKHDFGKESFPKTRKRISTEVSSKGLLGVLSGGSESAGDEVADLLGEGTEGEGSLNNVFNRLEGIEVTRAGSKDTRGDGGPGKNTHSVKGTRTKSGIGVNNIISGRSTAKSTSVKRKASIVVSEISSVANEEGIKSDGRNSDEVSEVVNKHNDAIQYCYQRELKRNPSLKGKLVVRFTIAPNGKVKEVTLISSTLNNSWVDRCVINRIHRWDDFGAIDPVKGDAVFRQVYTFGY